MDLRRVLKNTYELFDAVDVVRLAKSTFRDMAAYSLATRLLDANGDLVVVPVFLGSGLEPSADGTNANVTMKPGLALWYDASQGDSWLGEVTPVFFDTAQTASFTSNTSGNDRIDVLSVRPIEVEEDSVLRKFKDPISQVVSQQLSPQRVRLGFEFVVTEGVPAASPSVPATPTGTFKIAEVLRPNAQADVNAVDVTDARNLDRMKTGFVDAVSGLAARAGALYFGDPAGNHYKLERDDAVTPTVLQLQNQNGLNQDFEAAELKATAGLVSDTIQVQTNLVQDTIETKNFAGTNAAILLAKNTPWAFCRFGWNDPGGSLTNNDPADNLSGDFNITSVQWKISGSDIYAEVVLTTALAAVTGALAIVSGGGLKAGSGSITPFVNVQAEVVSTTVVHIYFSNAAGVMVEPYSASGLALHSLLVIDGDL